MFGNFSGSIVLLSLYIIQGVVFNRFSSFSRMPSSLVAILKGGKSWSVGRRKNRRIFRTMINLCFPIINLRLGGWILDKVVTYSYYEKWINFWKPNNWNPDIADFFLLSYISVQIFMNDLWLIVHSRRNTSVIWITFIPLQCKVVVALHQMYIAQLKTFSTMNTFDNSRLINDRSA